TFAVVRTCTWPNRIDVTPVIFALWMHERISIRLRSRSDQEHSVLLPGLFQHQVCSLAIDQNRLNGMFHIPHWTGRTGQVENGLRFKVKWFGYILLYKRKMWLMQ